MPRPKEPAGREYVDARFEVVEAKLCAIDTALDRIISILKSLAPAAMSPEQAQVTPREADLQLVSFNAKPIESNSTWTKWTWRLVIRNKTPNQLAFSAYIQFRDGDSFAVDHTTSQPYTVGPNQENEITDYHLVSAPVAALVRSVHATLHSV